MSAANTSPEDVPMLGRVMMVEDEAFDQRMCTRVLRRLGLAQDIQGFTYPADALAYLLDPSNDPVDLVLLDINMPGMNGLEFLTALQGREDSRALPDVAIMLTVPLGPAQRAFARSFPMVRAFINKPLTSEQFVSLAHHLHSGRGANVA